MELDEAIFGTRTKPLKLLSNAARVASLLQHMLHRLDHDGLLKGRFEAKIKVGAATVGRFISVSLCDAAGNHIDTLNVAGAPDRGHEEEEANLRLQNAWELSPNEDSLLSPYGFCNMDYQLNGHSGLDGEWPGELFP